METKCDILIVGAGLAGLSAARELLKHVPTLNVLVIEAKDRVGGRTLTIDLKGANGIDRWDIGGQWIGSTQKHTIKLIKALKLSTYPQYSTGTKLAQVGTTAIRPYTSTPPSGKDLRNFSLFEGADFVKTYRELGELAKKIDLRDVFELPEAERMDEMSLAEWVRQNCETQTVIDAIDVTCRNTFGMASKRLSLLCFLYYVRCSGSLAEIFGAENGGAQSIRVKGGVQQMSKIMAQQLGDSRVRLNTAVTNVDWDKDELRVSAISTDGKYSLSLIRCKRLILAIPPSEAGKIRYSQPLPYMKRQLFDCAPPGNLFKFIVTYKTAFWRAAGLSGEIISTGETDDPDEVLPIVQTYDATTNYGNPAIVGFIHNDIWTEKSLEERRMAVIEDLVRFIGEEARNYIDYVDKDWHLELFNGGCPGACVPTGNMEALMTIREPVDRIHFAGTESATHWPGFMSGAIQSGLRAAHEILCHVSPTSVKQKLLEGSVYEIIDEDADEKVEKKKSTAKDETEGGGATIKQKKTADDDDDKENERKKSNIVTLAMMMKDGPKYRSRL